MKHKKKLLILHITNTYGGAEQTTSHIISGIDRSFINDITLACPKSMLTFWKNHCDNWIDTDSLNLSSWYTTPYKTLRDSIIIGKTLRSHKIDLALGVMHYNSTLISIGSKALSPNTRTLSSFRGPVFQHLDHFEKSRWRRLWIGWTVCITSHLSHRITTPSTGTTNEIIQKCKINPSIIETIPNGIDLENPISKEHPTPTLPDKALNKPFIIIAARLSAEKRIDVAISALDIIKDETDVNLLILGDGSEKQRLESMRDNLGLDDRVFFIGSIQNPIPFIRKAKAYIHTCQYEGFGYSILEALACGTPVIATDCPFGPREVLENGAGGILVPMNAPTPLASAILKVISNKALAEQLSRKGLEIAGKLSLSKMIQMHRQTLIKMI